MKENKKEFIAAIETALLIDTRSGVKKIFFTDDSMEKVRIDFGGGIFILINVTANSNGATALEIMKAVYGYRNDVYGLIFYGHESEYQKTTQDMP